jgi:hypothetical protein
MGRTIRRTITITISECWTIVWTDEPTDDLSTTSDELDLTFPPRKEESDGLQEIECRAETVATQACTPIEASADES